MAYSVSSLSSRSVQLQRSCHRVRPPARRLVFRVLGVGQAPSQTRHQAIRSMASSVSSLADSSIAHGTRTVSELYGRCGPTLHSRVHCLAVNAARSSTGPMKKAQSGCQSLRCRLQPAPFCPSRSPPCSRRPAAAAAAPPQHRPTTVSTKRV